MYRYVSWLAVTNQLNISMEDISLDTRLQPYKFSM